MFEISCNSRIKTEYVKVLTQSRLKETLGCLTGDRH